jgi:Mg-chelatase subunit ChlI
MTFIRPFRAALALALSLPMAACFAQGVDGERAQQMAADLQKRFAAADANGDGRLTKDEAKGKMPFVYKHFDEIDTAHSGSIAIADIAAFARTKQAGRR